jgi:hypothetical protein
MSATATTTRPPDDRRSLNRGAPDRSLVQRMEALQRANDIRTRRAQLKRDLKAGRKHVLPLVDHPPDYLETMKAFDLLLATPKYGRVKANSVLGRCRIAPSKTLGALSIRQRRDMILVLSGRPPRPYPAPLPRDYEIVRSADELGGPDV